MKQTEEGYSEHLDNTFCYDMTCPCHESRVLIEDLAEAIEDGMATQEEANKIYRGKTV